MGILGSIAKWAGGSVSGYLADKGVPGADVASKKFENDTETPGFVRDRLKSERYGREDANYLRSLRKHLK